MEYNCLIVSFVFINGLKTSMLSNSFEINNMLKIGVLN